jgi:aminotransferase in exopolysaccharide biosynthesis
MKEQFVSFVKELYGSDFVPLHRPVFSGNEKLYLTDCIDSNFVSTVGKKVDEFEVTVSEFTGSKFAIATANGTSALHASLHVNGVNGGDEVITQALTFVATCNAIKYCGADPVFVDVDKDTMGMSPSSLESFLEKSAVLRNGTTYNSTTGKVIKACMPMHTFGLPCRIKEISDICQKWNLTLIEDSAESLGSFFGNSHTGTFSSVGAFSFNGNKIITTGGGGVMITNDENLAKRAKHITTTAKVPHPYEFVHDEVGFNYRMPNLNAALGCAQMEQLPGILKEKEKITSKYNDFFEKHGMEIVKPILHAKANNWLNAIMLNSKDDRNDFLNFTNSNGIITRPIWSIMSNLRMFENCQHDGLSNSKWLEARVVNIPSSVP